MKKNTIIGAGLLLVLAQNLLAVPQVNVSLNTSWTNQKAGTVTEAPTPDKWKPVKDKTIRISSNDNQWYERSYDVPSDWNGKRVIFDVKAQIRRIDIVLFVNGKKAGEILTPGGYLDITQFVEPGKNNIFRMFVTKKGDGISRGPILYDTKREGRAPQDGFDYMPSLIAADPTTIMDVYAKPSTRRQTLTLETEIISPADKTAVLAADIIDPAGKTVKTFKADIRLKKGTNLVKPEFTWKEPVFWELRAPYMYTVKAGIEDKNGKTGDEFPAFRFGFREIWRDGKELYMNGHILHLRPCYSFYANKWGARFLMDIGYNVITRNHDWSSNPCQISYNLDHADEYDDLGIGIFCSSGNVGIVKDDILKDGSERQKQYRHSVEQCAKRLRNHPSYLGFYITQMILCPSDNHRPEALGQGPGRTSPKDRWINKGREIWREYHPNALYFSHADGNNGDISSANLYLNWTPIQEKENWFKSWSKNGTYPYCAVEFGQPYDGCWWEKRNFIETEHLTAYFGDRAYAEEPEIGLRHTVGMSISNDFFSGKSPFFSQTDYPLFWELRKWWTWQMNRSARTYGLNGGLIYFNLHEAYGSPKEDHQSELTRYSSLTEQQYNNRKDWVNPAFEIHKLGNQDFCGYIGGAVEPSDKDHAFFAGTEVRKSLVFIWDGGKKKTFRADWKAVMKDGSVLASGTENVKQIPGTVVKKGISFPLPGSVKTKTSGTIQVTFYEDGKDVFKDQFAFEVYPAKIKPLKTSGSIAVIDPRRTISPILDAFGIRYKSVGTWEEAKNADYIIFAKYTLKERGFGADAASVAGGKKILLMAQAPESWQALGFQVQDLMARIVFLRDKNNPKFQTLTDDVLRFWAGTPKYGSKESGAVMGHNTQRGPRGLRDMTVAGLMLKIPERAGFTPLIVGEFDMNYAALMRLRNGKGSMTFCTLDLENRVGKDAAATETARAVLDDFLNGQESPADKQVYADGKQAQRLLGYTGINGVNSIDKADIILAGPDAGINWTDIIAKAEKGVSSIVYANKNLTEQAGFVTAPKEILRTSVPDNLLFRSAWPASFRWRHPVTFSMISHAPQGFTIFADGLGAYRIFGKAAVIVMQNDPFALYDKFDYNDDAQKELADANEAILKFYCSAIDNMTDPVKRKDKKIYCFVHRKFDNSREIAKRLGYTLLDKPTPGYAALVCQSANPGDVSSLNRKGIKIISFSDSCRFGVKTSTVYADSFDLPGYTDIKLPFNAEVPNPSKLKKPTLAYMISPHYMAVLVSPMFADIEKINRKHRQYAVGLTTDHQIRLFSFLLNNLNAQPGKQIAERAVYYPGAAGFEPVRGAFHVLGPFQVKKEGNPQLEPVFPGEDMAIAGDTNPNVQLDLPQGGKADWRPMLSADDNGEVNLEKLFPVGTPTVSYAVLELEREKDGDAVLKFGVDWRARIWCNGKEIARFDNGSKGPVFEVKLHMKKGKNILTFKIGSGMFGNKFWCMLSNNIPEDVNVSAQNPDLEKVRYDSGLMPVFDPYTFVYW